MKMEVENSVSFNTLQGNSQTFGIGANGQAFLLKALSKTVYANPIGTIVREYVSNAYDANKEQKNDEDPVLIKLANDANGMFLSVTDFGPGLSLDRIENVFCLYGESTKRETNDQIGGFGIGAKSAFSYTDMFFINTVSEGILYKYVLHSTSEGFKMQPISSEPTELKSGTEIKIYIKNQADREKYRQEIFNQLRYFDGVYFDGNPEFNNFQLYEYNHFKYSSQKRISPKFEQLHVCLGKVAYPLNFDIIGERVIHLPLALKFDIGELEVTLSREELQYSEKTIKAIKQKLSDFRLEVNQMYENQKFEFTNLTDFFKARRSNPSLLLPDNIAINLKESLIVKRKPCIFKPFQSLDIKIPDNPYFYMDCKGKLNDKFNIVMFDYYERGYNFAAIEEIFVAKSKAFIFLDQKPTIQKNKFVFSRLGGIKIIKPERRTYREYVNFLGLPRAGKTGDTNNLKRILLYKKFLNDELFKYIPVYSKMELDKQWLENENEDKKARALTRKLMKQRDQEGSFEVSNLKCPHGKNYLIDKLYKKNPVPDDANIVLFCEKGEIAKYSNIIKALDNNMLFDMYDRQIKIYAVRNSKDMQYFQNRKKCIHFEDFVNRVKLTKKVKSRLSREAMRRKLQSVLHDNDTIEDIITERKDSFPTLYRAFCSYEDLCYSIDYFFLEKTGLNIDNFIPEAFYKELRVFKKIFKHAPFVLEFGEDSLNKPYIKQLLSKVGLRPGKNSYQPIDKWEEELIKETQNKVKYLQSLKA